MIFTSNLEETTDEEFNVFFRRTIFQVIVYVKILLTAHVIVLFGEITDEA